MQALKPFDEVQVDFSRRYTLEEFWELPKREDDARYELIDGYLTRFLHLTRITGTLRPTWQKH